MNHNSPQVIRTTLSHLGIYPHKRWGQNFLINHGVREKLVALLSSRCGQCVWEIGPGLGAITDVLLHTDASEIVLFEIDWKLIDYLRSRYSECARIRVVPGDFLKKWRQEAEDYGPPEKVVGNLPYRSAAAIIGSFIRHGTVPERMVFTVQKELADRITARPREKNYSSFSVLAQLCFRLERHGDIGAGSFYPRPEVTSTIIELCPQEFILPLEQQRLLMDLMQTVFRSRRKTIRNNLKGGRIGNGMPDRFILEACEQSEIDPNSRAEEYPPEAYLRLVRKIGNPAG